MINHRNLLNSAGMSILNVVLSACTLFILYKYLLSSIGIDKLGIWALILAATSIARISEFGMSTSVVKFVSKYLVLDKHEEAGNVVQTAIISTGCLTAIALIAARPLIEFGLTLFISNEASILANELLPYALLSLWMSMVTSVLFSGFDGCQKIALRNGITIIGNILYLPTAVLLVSKYGLVGLACAQLLQSFLILIISWVLLRRVLSVLPKFPNIWNKLIFKEIILYSVGLQITGLLAMLIEPLTKALLSKFGGLSMVGYFEMASRMVSQFRSLLVSVNQIIVPVIARQKEVSPENIKNTYAISYRLLFYFSLPAYAGLFSMIPLISELWIGSFQHDFVILSMLVTIGALLNSLVNPAYFVNLGIGNLKANMIGYIVMSFLNGASGYLFGSIFGGIGVALAYVISLSIGSWVILIFYHFRQNIPIINVFPRESLTLTISSVTGSLLTLLIYFLLRDHMSTVIISSICILFFSIISMFSMWNHPMRTQLAKWAGMPE
jgi:O-antigen/teichoic acid export membrane protein